MLPLTSVFYCAYELVVNKQYTPNDKYNILKIFIDLFKGTVS